MAEFYESTLWMKLTMMLISGAFSMHLFSMDAPGWGQYQNSNCQQYYSAIGICRNPNALRAVQALEVIGFLSVLTALFLSLCLVLLDELKGNKLALICLTVFSLIAGVAIIVGIAVYEGTTNINTTNGGFRADGSEYGSTIGVMAGVCALTAGVFCILELGGVCIRYDDHGHRQHIDDHGHRHSDDHGHRKQSGDHGHKQIDDHGHRQNIDDHGHRNNDRERATVH